MIHKIISGGQTGVELAALDVAIKLGISHGGWTPRGHRNESGKIKNTYGLKESSSLGFQQAIEKNVLESDGTLLISRGQKTPQTKHAVQKSLQHQRQFLHADLRHHSPFETASLINSWMSLKQIKTVYITGLAASQDQSIYSLTQKILETAFYLGFVKSGLHPDYGISPMSPSEAGREILPKTVDEAVQRLKSALPLKDRTMLANMQPDELDHLNTGLGEYIKQNFGLYVGNQPLLQSCAATGDLNQPLPDEACAVILHSLWKDLHNTHRLRVIK